MAKRVEYDRLRTIGDVRRERRRVQKAIERTDEFLEDAAEQLGKFLSVDYWSGVLAEKAAELIERATSNVASRLRGISSLFNLFGSLFRRFGSDRPGGSRQYSRDGYPPREEEYIGEFDDPYGDDGYDEEYDILIEREPTR